MNPTLLSTQTLSTKDGRFHLVPFETPSKKGVLVAGFNSYDKRLLSPTRDGTLVALLPDGLTLQEETHDSNSVVRRISPTFDRSEPLEERQVTALLALSNGLVALGHAKGGVRFLHLATGKTLCVAMPQTTEPGFCFRDSELDVTGLEEIVDSPENLLLLVATSQTVLFVRFVITPSSDSVEVLDQQTLVAKDSLGGPIRGVTHVGKGVVCVAREKHLMFFDVDPLVRRSCSLDENSDFVCEPRVSFPNTSAYRVTSLNDGTVVSLGFPHPSEQLLERWDPATGKCLSSTKTNGCVDLVSWPGIDNVFATLTHPNTVEFFHFPRKTQ